MVKMSDDFSNAINQVHTIHKRELAKAQRLAAYWEARVHHTEETLDRTGEAIDPEGHVGFSDGHGALVTVVSDPGARLVRIVTGYRSGERHSVAFLPHEEEKLIRGLREAFQAVTERSEE